MFLRQLEYLVAVADERHFGRAAVRCNVSQSGLSAAIHSLEAELGVPLVVRDRLFRHLSPEGVDVVRWSRAVLASWARIRRLHQPSDPTPHHGPHPMPTAPDAVTPGGRSPDPLEVASGPLRRGTLLIRTHRDPGRPEPAGGARRADPVPTRGRILGGIEHRAQRFE